MSGLVVALDKCVGCGRCVRSCANKGIRIEGRKAIVTDSCTACGICVGSCRFGALEIVREDSGTTDLGSYHDVWVYAQHDPSSPAGEVAPVAFELLGKGRELADARACNLVCVLGEHIDKGGAELLLAHGADEVIVCRDERLSSPNAQVYAQWICSLVRERKPEMMLFGATNFGRELAPAIAASLRTGLTADCTVLNIDEDTGLLQQTRPAFGGNLMATIVCPNHRPQLATVRPGVLQAPDPIAQPNGIVTQVKLPADVSTSLSFERFLPHDNLDSITDADVLVIVGRGIGSQKNLALMRRFAELIGAKVGCSRPLVESGWMEYPHQVGQTGCTVAPRVLVIIGVSGAIQHLAGIGGAQTIISINTDPTAPIVGVSQYAVIGDAVEIVKELVEQLQADA